MAMNQQFNLRWNNHTANILQVFAEQLSNESLVDVTLSCQGQFFKAHKMVLSACSPYFQELFSLHQVQHPVIILNGMKFRDLKMVVEFMYRGEIKVLEAELGGLLGVAEALQVKGLSNVRNKYEKGEIHGATAQDSQASPNEMSEDSSPHPFHDEPSSPVAEEPKKTNESPKQTRKRKRASDEVKDPLGCEKSPPKKSSKKVSPSICSDEHPNNSHVLPFVQVTMNEYLDDDLPSTIKVEPLFIRDIDDVDASWDDPSRLVIDLPAEENKEEREGSKDEVARVGKEGKPKKNRKSTKSVPIKTAFVPKTQLVKLRPTSELLASSPSKSVNNDDAVTATSSSNPATPNPEPKTEDPTFDGTTSAIKENILSGTSFLGNERRGKHGKIPRPPNAFMIFANEWRRKLAVENPCESNKQISVRLGVKWKNLSAEKKEFYYSASRLADEEHKRKYPNYYYSPKEARLRKSQMQALRQKVAARHIALSTPVPAATGNLGTNPLHFVKVYVKSKAKEPSVFLNSETVEVKKEILDNESSEQNLEEEFLKMVEEGHVEAQVADDSGDLPDVPDSHDTEPDNVTLETTPDSVAPVNDEDKSK